MAFEARNRTLADWFTRIRTRQIALPRFQRFQAWGHTQVTQLFNTVLQGLPVGAVLILEIGDAEPFLSRTMVGAPEEGERITEHLLDGQQRLTALWRGLHNDYEDRTYFLFLETDEETGAPYFVESIARWKKDGDTEFRPFWANDPREQWSRRMIPLELCRPSDDGAQRFREWARQAIEDRDEIDRVADQLSNIRTGLTAFNLPYLSLPAATRQCGRIDSGIGLRIPPAASM